ncbi:MAG: 50S ribosomal protein L4 [Candidatus Brennerbacteria bacterium]|nr:50S ribosomal protein L4 [Candidatus Brennerbacteria bacterium]
MKMDVYDKQNKKAGTIDLPEKIFKAKWNPALVHQVLVAENANRRSPWANVKGRGEVRGGGRKPWQQKGTGRARHGSIRSPIWVGGGVTHGPTAEKIYAKKINKKMKQAAVHAVLSRKAGEGEIRIIDDLKLSEPKTKIFAGVLKNFSTSSVLVVPGKENKGIVRAARNIPKVKVTLPDSLNVSDCLTYKNIFFEKEAVKEIR